MIQPDNQTMLNPVKKIPLRINLSLRSKKDLFNTGLCALVRPKNHRANTGICVVRSLQLYYSLIIPFEVSFGFHDFPLRFLTFKYEL